MSSASQLSKSLRLSSTLKIDEEAMVTKIQGIGSILGSDCERSNKASSLRRTLSADMSSTKWLTQHGFSPMKKIASSEEFSISAITDTSSSEGEEDYEDERKGIDESEQQHGQFDFWSSIQEEVYKKKELEKSGQFDIWNSIISQKAQEDSSKSLPSPYIHPLVKRSARCLSGKSLEICTESLGSETGSDGFSSYPSSETGDTDDDKEMEQEHLVQQQPQDQSQERVLAQSFDVEEAIRVPKYNYVVGKKSPQRSFPPPIPSLSRNDGASIRMQSRRDNGRLVLEAVSVPSTNNFRAQRQDGRLVLTFVNSFSIDQEVPKNEEEDYKEVEVFEEEFDNIEDEEKESDGIEEEEEETEDEEVEESEKQSRGEMEMQFAMEQAPTKPSSVINLHRLTLVMNKPMGLANRDQTWPKKFNEVVKFEEVDIKPTIVAQSLPSAPRMARLIATPSAATATVSTAAGASFNAYEYFWRPKPMTAAGAVLKPINQLQPQSKAAANNSKLILSKSSVKNEQQQVLVFSGNKGDYLVPLPMGCKEPRRSLLFWEPHCIATS